MSLYVPGTQVSNVQAVSSVNSRQVGPHMFIWAFGCSDVYEQLKNLVTRNEKAIRYMYMAYIVEDKRLLEKPIGKYQ